MPLIDRTTEGPEPTRILITVEDFELLLAQKRAGVAIADHLRLLELIRLHAWVVVDDNMPAPPQRTLAN